MDVVYNWDDLKRFGLDLRTGEQDALNLRGLFEVTEKGRDLLQSFLDIPLPTSENLANGVLYIQLPYSIFATLATYALLLEGKCHTVVVIATHGHYRVCGLVGDEKPEMLVEHLGRMEEVERIVVPSNHPNTRFNNHRVF